jgi:squalene synthase HpnC/squalene synthase HpnD
MDSPAELKIARTLPPADCSLADARSYTRWLASHHYENFHIATWFLPRRLRQPFCDIYAYCRWADDLGDEVSPPLRALELLDAWEGELESCFNGRPSHPVFIALAPTVRAFGIPAQPFRDLLAAFRQDQTVRRYDSWGNLLDYCCYSANPVGRLVLYVCGYRDAGRQQLSDATCTALQLANFWQDVSRDLDKGRLYLPVDALSRHGLTPADIEARRFDGRYVALMRDLIMRTRELFVQGLPLLQNVDARLRVDLDLFSRGGVAVLDAIEAAGWDTLRHRPVIGRRTRAFLLARATLGTLRAMSLPGDSFTGTIGPPVPSAPSLSRNTATDSRIEESYAACRNVARRAASNFYYAFYILPRSKRDALCALYAFMRLVDDVSDAPAIRGNSSTSREARLAGLSRWRALLDQAVAGQWDAHPILPAFADTLRRFAIPSRYFHDLISGAEMDLTETRYSTFERLREYCYRVAGTVGLTCLHVFGSDHPRAPELSERLGIAFQLTNILRDVREDFALGRVYLPEDELARFGCVRDDLGREAPTMALRELLRAHAERAWDLYREGSTLVGIVHPDSRAALWVLIRIYSSLLARIEERNFDVFSARVRLPLAEKARIVAFARLGWWSEADVLEERNGHRRRAGGTFFRRRAG